MLDDELPLGIFLLAVLQGLQALGLFLVGGLWLLFPILGLFVAIPYAIAGFFGLFIAIGLFTLQEYAWTWAFILNIIGAILYLFGSNLFGIILSGIILVYLIQPNIKDKFN
ncbi:hypothetical protein E4H12_02970 [Candidatus Thorarchaeota archaeon]|nr:MAG: hypothetical protein E4H12_02970 [Candidatus Thorarchaeota archaeon]